jgi:hypothetical protein
LTFAAIAEEWFTHYRQQKEFEGKPLAPSTIEQTVWLLNLKEYRAKGDKGGVAHFLHALSQRQIRTITQLDIAEVMELLAGCCAPIPACGAVTVGHSRDHNSPALCPLSS